MIVVSDISYAYPNGVQALRNVTLHADAGTTVCVLGHNGSGKSTLMRMLNGLLRPSEGSVVVDGIDLSTIKTARASALVGVCFQNPDSQLFCATVADEVRFGAEHAGGDGAAVERRIEDALDLLDLQEVRDENPYGLSLSLRKRVAIASVIAMDTPAVVLDEPTGNLDNHGTQLITGLISHLTSRGRSIILVTHDIDLAGDVADHVVVMKAGRVHLAGTPDRVFADPTHEAAGIVAPTMSRISRGLTGGDDLATMPALTRWLAQDTTAERGTA